MMRAFCDRCDEPLHPDDKYARCTDPWGGNVEFICESCRERAYDRDQERLMETGGGPSLIEQQRDAYRIKHGIRG